jgi:alpha-D-ribose 1-methylphosphonate 5-triphosphate synthase subunit PhnG
MLQIDGKTSAVAERQDWMRLLARAPLDLLETELGRYAGAGVQWLRAPQSGLVMAQGRVGGSGARFNLGEVSVTRCALRIDPAVAHCGAVGVAYVLGRAPRHAELAATADALLQDPASRELLPAGLLERLAQHVEAARRRQQAQAQATRVEFFTVAREAGAAPDDIAEELS